MAAAEIGIATVGDRRNLLEAITMLPESATPPPARQPVHDILRLTANAIQIEIGSTDQGRTIHENRRRVRDANVGTRPGGKASPHRPWNKGQE
jgi:hypothetical protein